MWLMAIGCALGRILRSVRDGTVSGADWRSLGGDG